MKFLLIFSSFSFIFSIHFINSSYHIINKNSKFFIFDWPHDLQFSIPPKNATLLITTKREGYLHSQGENFGNGKLLDKKYSIYQSSVYQFYHFSLSKLRVHPKRTFNYSQADFYVLPYDIGFSLAFSKVNGEFWKKPWIHCPEYNQIIPLLQAEINRTGLYGHNILVFNSVFDIFPTNCQEIINYCLNCTFLSFDLEDYDENQMYQTFNVRHIRLNRRVFSVPYPTSRRWDEHTPINLPFANISIPLPNSTLTQFSPTIQQKYSRPILATYWGTDRVWYKPATKLRGYISSTCIRHPEYCLYLRTLNRFQTTASKNLSGVVFYANSVFCLQPPGDGESRKGIFDSFAVGCIPVISANGLMNKTFPWFFTKELEEQTTVYVSHSSIIRQNKDIITDILLKIPIEEIEQKRKSIEFIAKSLQYAVPPAKMKGYIGYGGAPGKFDGQKRWKPPFNDAIDVIIDSMTSLSRRYKETRTISEDEAPNRVPRWEYLWADKPLPRNPHPIVIL